MYCYKLHTCTDAFLSWLPHIYKVDKFYFKHKNGSMLHFKWKELSETLCPKANIIILATFYKYLAHNQL